MCNNKSEKHTLQQQWQEKHGHEQLLRLLEENQWQCMCMSMNVCGCVCTVFTYAFGMTLPELHIYSQPCKYFDTL